MSASAIDTRRQAAKIALIYLIIAIFCAAFGAIYELFSHEVYSFFMLYAFAFPLCGGVLPYLLYALSGKPLPHPWDRLLGHAGIAALTVGSIVTGVLEIYGTTNLLTRAYWVVGAVLFLGFVLRILTLRVPHASDDPAE